MSERRNLKFDFIASTLAH